MAHISTRAKWFKRLLKRILKPIFNPRVPIQVQRTTLELLAKSTIIPRGVDFTTYTVGSIECLMSQTKTAAKNSRNNKASDPVILFLHGGAYCIGKPSIYKSFFGHLAKQSGLTIFAPDYRLAPENPYPAALDDALLVYQHLLNQYDKVIVMGDSAGGGLAVSLAVSLRDLKQTLPAALVLMSPLVDLTCSSNSHQSKADKDATMSKAWLMDCARHYVTHRPLDHPLCSPLFSPLHNMPRTLIQVGGDEILLDDAANLASKLDENHTDVTFTVYPDMWHVFQNQVDLIPESQQALAQIIQFLRK